MDNIKLIRINRFFIMGLGLLIIGDLISIIIPLYIKKMIDIKLFLNSSAVTKFPFELIFLLVLQIIVNSIGNYIISREGERQIAAIRNKIQNHLLHLPISFFDNHDSGKLSSRVINDSVVVKNFLTGTIPQTISSVLIIIGTLIVLIYLDFKLTLALIIIFPLEALITIPLGKIEEKITKSSQKSLSNLSGITTESLRNIRSIKVNIAEKNMMSIFKKHLKKLYELSIKSDAIFSITSPIQSFVSFTLIAIVLFYGGIRIQEGSLTIGTLTSFLIYFVQIISPINTIALYYTSYKQTKGSIEKVIQILNTNTEDYSVKKSNLVIHNPYYLSMRNIKFSYNNSYNNNVILKDINMSFPSNKKIAIVGPSGAGKSTIINLITRLYNPQEGTIYMNGINSQSISLKDWRSMFGVVSQENTIISGTIFDNLVLGLNYTPTTENIENALKVCNLDGEISKFKNGINEVVGEQGIRLSGGQRQRLQIARAYLKKPSFLILDEATSNLDADSESKIMAMLKKVMNEGTIIAIAHRLSTITDSDKIYFLDNNIISGVGTHEELLNYVPKYSRFVNEQFIKK